ncbi:ferredoxin--NADP reductase [Galbibacter sp. EGI 63066]|uniref:ferredoxin--NADP reductase n=1 Tax=Galbibacter sp. EGI 63066 TaxID=2993559 RepID=UPI002248EB93|nr:ferredoxin--NADP reductase [Galbibacter sp. EGI 63066]MCX2679114.1 ferredoxin--NADP reductase [Galbibacter sp. EGI 63066]
MIHFHTLTVKAVDKITPKSIVITFEIPENLSSEFKFEPGQYITIKKEINGEELRRSYSICSSPDVKNISVGIKEMPNGTFSKYAQTISAGDTFEVHPPDGRFIFDPKSGNDKTIAAFAAGSGITPIMSIMKTVLEKTDSSFLLAYGNKTVENTMFYNDILKLKETYPERLNLHFLFSQSQEEGVMFGRIERSTINYLLKNKYKDIAFDAFYICGPEEMLNTLSETLSDNGIEEDRIKVEHFTSTDDHEAPDDIPEGKTKVKALVDEEEFEFIMDHKERVLDAALKEDIDAPYSCQGGICSSCMARLKKGKVEMVNNQILTDSELEEGFILTCQAHPLTDSIEIDYDDV